MKIACVFQFVQIDDQYYIKKEDSLKYTLEQLVKEDHDVRLYSLSETGNYSYVHEGVVYEFGLNNDSLLMRIKKFNADFYILNSFNMCLHKYIGINFPDAKKLLIYCGGIIQPPEENIDTIIISTEEMKEKLIKSGCDKEIKVSSFGVNTELFKPKQINNHKWDIIYAADWRENKRQELLIKALGYIKNVTCLFLGAQTGNYNYDYYQKMKSLIKEMGLKNRVTCIDRVAGKQMVQYYQQSKICIHLGRSLEGGARSPIEAMACGLPVIVTTDCLSNISRIANEVEGLWAKPIPIEIAMSINKLLTMNKSSFLQIQKNARARVKRYYTYERFYNAINEAM